MAAKTEMITFILENSEEYTQAYLETLSYKNVKSIYDSTETLEIVNVDLDENVDEEIIDDLDESLDNDLDESLDMSEDIIEEIEEEVWDYNKLSPNDQRLYRRSGIKRISKSKIYTRFIDENPRI